ncbi:MAG TPA: ATP-dependent DNA ligase [Actinomycetota bacterium]|jgi:ATP-dependent DNA ligase|nr:ATP-dependent DNA ligase [Actinomycetota bacterium]
MLAKLEPEIPRGEGWTYEPKWDGFRTIVTVGHDGSEGVRLASRDDRPMMRFFPEIVAILADRPAGAYVADGEIVLVRPGRLSFDELQLRLHPAASRVQKLSAETPATLILFDLLEEEGEDLRDLALEERRTRLASLAERVGAARAPDRLEELPLGPDLRLTPWTEDVAVAERWFADEAGLGQDGILAKLADQPYQPGKRGWVKVKHRRTADCVVGGYRVAKAGGGVGSLLLGLYDGEGHLHYVGHTSSFRAAERRAIRELLAPLEGGESFGGGREPGGPSRWSAGKDMAWVEVRPELVCEVSFDRMQGGRMRHAATFVRWREDRDPRSCTFDQLGESPPSWG